MSGSIFLTAIAVSIAYLVFRFIEMGTELVEIEGGVAENESTSIALQKAIEQGVLNIIKIGIERRYWEYETIKIDDPCNDTECVIDVRG